MIDLLQPAQHRISGEVVKLLAAQIIVAALHVTDVQLALAAGEKRLLQKRDILVEELLLQVLRAGRNNDAFARANHRQEISQRLAGARAGLDDQMPLFFERLFHGLRHLQLPAPKFVGGVGLREQAARREELVQRESRSPRHGMGHGMG